MLTRLRTVTLACSLLTLAGCSQIAVQPPSSIYTPPAIEVGSHIEAPPPSKADILFVPGDYAGLEQLTAQGRPAATSELITSGRVAWQSGDTNEALQKFNRAMRISPSDGLIYYYLATISKEEFDYQKASTLARRGLSFSRHQVLREQLESLLSTIGY